MKAKEESISLEERQKEIVAAFARHDDWLDKYELLIEEGRNLKPLDEAFRSEVNALPGCQSQVWIKAEAPNGRLEYFAESDSAVIRGVLALLAKAFQGRPPEEVASAEITFLSEIGLESHLSPARANGVALIVRRMRELAHDLASG